MSLLLNGIDEQGAGNRVSINEGENIKISGNGLADSVKNSLA
jgi:hypothetical protein